MTKRNNTGAKLKAGWKKLPLGAKIVIGGLGAYAGYKIINGIFSTNVKKAPVDYGQIPQVYSTQGGQNILWNPDPLAKELATNLIGANLYTYPETTDKILPLNKDQASLLYNHYNTYYAVPDYPTLTKQIEGEWSDPYGSYDKAVTHLKSFGLNERANKGLNALRRNGHLR